MKRVRCFGSGFCCNGSSKSTRPGCSPVGRVPASARAKAYAMVRRERSLAEPATGDVASPSRERITRQTNSDAADEAPISLCWSSIRYFRSASRNAALCSYRSTDDTGRAVVDWASAIQRLISAWISAISAMVSRTVNLDAQAMPARQRSLQSARARLRLLPSRSSGRAQLRGVRRRASGARRVSFVCPDRWSGRCSRSFRDHASTTRCARPRIALTSW